MLKDANVTSGRVAVNGTYDIGATFGLLMSLQKLMPEIEFIGEQRCELHIYACHGNKR